MDIKTYVYLTKDLYDVDQKLGTLKTISKEALETSDLHIHLLAEARIRFWETTQLGRLPYDSIAMFRTVVNLENVSDIERAISKPSQVCATAPFGRLPEPSGRIARGRLSRILNEDVSTPNLLSQFKSREFAKGLGLALGANLTSKEDAIAAALTYSSPSIPEAASTNAVGLANELAFAGELEHAYEILRHVISSADSCWSRASLFAAENRIRAHVGTADSSFLGAAADHVRTVINNVGNEQQSSELIAMATKRDSTVSLDTFVKMENPAMARVAFQLLTRIMEVQDQGDPSTLRDFFTLDPLTGNYT